MEKINVYDLETYEENNKIIPYCACFIIDNKQESIYWKQDEDLITESFKKIAKISNNDSIDIFVHNINFDGILIIESLTKNNINFNWIIKKNDIFLIRFTYLGCLFKIRCSYKLIPISLKNAIIYEKEYIKKIFPYRFASFNNLEYVGLPPDFIFFDGITLEEYNFFKIENFLFNFKEYSVKYCMNDVLLTQRLVFNIYKIIKNIDEILFWKSFSSSSLSNNFFFKHYNIKKINKNLSKIDSNYIKWSYYGGRCEVFGNIKKNEIINHFDFSGMYGQCMLQKFPVGSGYFSKQKNISEIGFHLIEYESNMHIPVLPHHAPSGKLTFPNGKILGCFWYEEIELFLKENGKILKHYSSYVYDNSDFIFNDFLSEFNEIKKKGGYYKLFSKLIINSLYGSFALNEDEDFVIITFSEKEFFDILKNTNVLTWINKNNCFIITILKDYKSKEFYNKKEKKWSESMTVRNLAYASIIASKARIKLYDSLKDIKKNEGRILYCDTDSYYAAFKKSMIGKKCGEITWSDEYNDGFFIAPKFYGLKNSKETILKIKGVSEKGEKYDEIKKNFYSDKSIITFENQLKITKKNLTLNQEYIKKNININKYDKRVFNKNKTTTSPLNI